MRPRFFGRPRDFEPAVADKPANSRFVLTDVLSIFFDFHHAHSAIITDNRRENNSPRSLYKTRSQGSG